MEVKSLYSMDKNKLIGFANDVEREIRDLEEENAALKAELDYWKGNAEGFQPDAYMKLPLDADGVPIEVGDTVYCDDDPEQLVVDSFDGPGCVCIKLAKSPNGILYAIEPSRLSRECPDSWEKLEEDALKYQCAYFFGISEDKNTTCANCKKSSEVTGIPCRLNIQIDLVKRAKRLAGVEEQEGE